MVLAAPLPIDDVLSDVQGALIGGRSAVLVAPPGAGKTTRVPLALLDEPWRQGRRILVLEPRRIAARAAATRMAATLGERLGQSIGLRARLNSQTGPQAKIEVVTEGVFTRMILDDPELSGVAAVLFDEFHERSIDADLGLAFALDCQSALRPDLRVLVMSATLEASRVAALLDNAPVITSEGRAFPVETVYLGRGPGRIEDDAAAAVMTALRQQTGSMLVFLPGQGEIIRVAERLAERVSGFNADLAPLYGALTPEFQDRAIEPARAGRRKIVLATSIAETSITIEGVSVVIDCGLARVPRYEPDVGVTRLETVRVSRASADQRRGRAGRTGPGVCYRLWDEAQTSGLLAFAEPEIKAADLSGLVLDCAEWGAADPATLRWLDFPPPGALKAAQQNLRAIGALDTDGRITADGKRLRALPLPPRVARMVLSAAERGCGQDAAEIAAILVERGIGGNDTDVSVRLTNFRRDRSRRADDLRRLAAGWAKSASSRSSEFEQAAAPHASSVAAPHPSPLPIECRNGEREILTSPSPRVRGEGRDEGQQQAAAQAAAPHPNPLPVKNGEREVLTSPSPRVRGEGRGEGQMHVHGLGRGSVAEILALAYPERIAKARGAPGQFLLANGRAGSLDAADPIARSPYLVVAEMQGSAAASRILLAASADEDEIVAIAGPRITASDEITFDIQSASVRARRVRKLGAITLSAEPLAVRADALVAEKLALGIVDLGIEKLPWSKAQLQFRQRVAFLRQAGDLTLPELSDAALARDAETWLAPFLAGKTRLSDITGDDLQAALDVLVPWPEKQKIETQTPTHFEAPTGNRFALDYEGAGAPVLHIRVQELFGLKSHPQIANGRLPLTLVLLSPAHRPIQITRDLPAFWSGSWTQVRADMRGQYPRHAWPEDPANAPPTARAKPRGT